jgi:hypothetical protein
MCCVRRRPAHHPPVSLWLRSTRAPRRRPPGNSGPGYNWQQCRRAAGVSLASTSPTPTSSVRRGLPCCNPSYGRCRSDGGGGGGVAGLLRSAGRPITLRFREPGSPPITPTAPPAAVSKGGSATQQEIEALYGKYNPEKLADVPALLVKYGEDRLISMVRFSPTRVVAGGCSVGGLIPRAYRVRRCGESMGSRAVERCCRTGQLWWFRWRRLARSASASVTRSAIFGLLCALLCATEWAACVGFAWRGHRECLARFAGERVRAQRADRRTPATHCGYSRRLQLRGPPPSSVSPRLLSRSTS